MSAAGTRAVLAAAAADYLAHGWPVAPGAWWSPQLRRYQCGRARCRVTGPHAVDVFAGGPDAGRCRTPVASCVVRPGHSARWWGRRPYGLLLPTTTIGVIEGPADLVDALDEWLRSHGHAAPLGTAPTSPSGRRELFCGLLQVDQEMWLAAASAGVLIHGEQSWVTLPPSVTRAGTGRWLRSPAECGWSLPPAQLVTDGLARALGTPPVVDVDAVAAGAVMV